MQGDDTEISTSAPVESSAPEPVSQVSEATASESESEPSKEGLLGAVLEVVKTTEEPTVGEDKAKETVAEEKTPEEGESEEDEESNTEAEANAEEEPTADTPAPVKRKLRKLQKEAMKLKHEIETLKPSSEIGQQLQNYAEANRLSSQDVVLALDLASMVARGDYKAFYEVISPLVRHAQEYTGLVLPPDLQQMVEQKQMTPEAAQQFAQTRFEKANYEYQAQNLAQQHQTQQVHLVKDDVQRSVSAFEQRLAQNDPDYKAKAEMVRRTAQAMLAERGNYISSVDEALQITQAAYAEVNNQFRRLRQPVRATAPTPGISNPQTPAARTAPKSLMEAAMQGLANSKRA